MEAIVNDGGSGTDDDDIYEGMVELERKSIAFEEKIDGHLKRQFLEAEVLDRRADCVDEAFGTTLDRFDAKAQKRNAASVLDCVSVSNEGGSATSMVSHRLAAPPPPRLARPPAAWVSNR